jgi:hypothetical protein
MVTAYGLTQPPSAWYYYLGISAGPLPPSNEIMGVDRLNVNSIGGVLAFGQAQPNQIAKIDQYITNGGVFVVFSILD